MIKEKKCISERLVLIEFLWLFSLSFLFEWNCVVDRICCVVLVALISLDLIDSVGRLLSITHGRKAEEQSLPLKTCRAR